jgi:hypothetical protein
MNKISAPIANGTPMRRPDNLDAHSPGAQAMRLSPSERSKRIGPKNRPKRIGPTSAAGSRVGPV